MNAEFSGHYFYMKTNVEEDFQIYISVPLTLEFVLYDS